MLRLFKRTWYLIKLTWTRRKLEQAINAYETFLDEMSGSFEDMAHLMELRNRMEIIAMSIEFMLEENH